MGQGLGRRCKWSQELPWGPAGLAVQTEHLPPHPRRDSYCFSEWPSCTVDSDYPSSSLIKSEQASARPPSGSLWGFGSETVVFGAERGPCAALSRSW